MVVRRILFVMAAVLVVIGASELLFTSWWLHVAREIMDSPSLYLYGLPAVLFGVILLIAVLERGVCLRAFLAILSIVVIVEGALLLANPDLVRDAMDTIFLNRSYGFQRFVIWLSGVLRILIGSALFYALARPPSARAEVGPENSDGGTAGPGKSYS